MKKTPLKRTDIRKHPDGSWKSPVPLKPIGKRGKRLNSEDAKTKAQLIKDRGRTCELESLGGCDGPVDVHHIRTKAAHRIETGRL